MTYYDDIILEYREMEREREREREEIERRRREINELLYKKVHIYINVL